MEVDPLLKDLSEKKQNFRRNVVSLAAELKDVRSRLSSREESFARETTTRKMAETKARSMEEEVGRLQKCLEEKNGRLQASAATSEQYLKELDDLRSQLSITQAIAEASAASAESAESQCRSLLKELEGKNNSLKEHEIQVNKLGEQLDLLQKDLQARELSQRQLKDEVMRIEEEIMHAIAESGATKDCELMKILDEVSPKNIENMKKHLNSKDEEITRLRDEIRLSAHWKQKTKELESQIEKHRRADQELKKRIVKLEFCLQESRSQTRKLQRMGEKRDQALKELRDQLAMKQWLALRTAECVGKEGSFGDLKNAGGVKEGRNLGIWNMSSSLKQHLTRKTDVLEPEEEIQKGSNNLAITQIPAVSKEIKEVRVEQIPSNDYPTGDGIHLTIQDKNREDDSSKVMVHLGMGKSRNADCNSHSGSFHHTENGSQSGEEGSSGTVTGYRSSSYPLTAPSPLSGLPEISQLSWGHWFTLRDLEIATNRFSRENVLGEGGYGVVYQGCLINGIPVAVKRLLNNMGQAEKEFRVEVEAIGHVRHKNLVRFWVTVLKALKEDLFSASVNMLRMLVYEYVSNGNLEQWLHGAMRQHGNLTWEARIKILLGTAKALAYLHEAIEPKVVHRDIKSSNILIDDGFNAKVSDFGLAKLLGAGKSHIATRVMGTFGYVAPEYANSGLLNEKSDIYSFGVVLLEAITGRDPVDYGRPSDEVNLVDWLKTMVGSRRSEEVMDPSIETKPSARVLKRALLIALRCVDPDPEKRPRMSQVVRMLESDEPIPRADRRRRHNHGGSTETDSQRENSDTDKSDNPDSNSNAPQNR
ncbi:hypothetical protein J5N97_014166 [Dioscorea zingiberensis]|uniref:non-specific serine/threonine protein kinase n=1 Tax=Dioscorea zingiberensis TaxID=325984 RepID=A0A9D5HJT4_9LILI|nr:hypothetical protein J5N97_014166 [Dioscorea zingiberensis]